LTTEDPNPAEVAALTFTYYNNMLQGLIRLGLITDTEDPGSISEEEIKNRIKSHLKHIGREDLTAEAFVESLMFGNDKKQ